MTKRIIHWFHRDLRVTDNTALYSASREAAEIVPAYILSTWKGYHRWTGPNRQKFLCGCLDSLAKNLEHLGGRLILRSGSPAEELVKLALESGAQAIYFNQNYGPYDVQIEQHIRQTARSAGIEVRAFRDTLILAPEEVLNQAGKPFRIFTAYAKGAASTRQGETAASASANKNSRSDQVRADPDP